MFTSDAAEVPQSDQDAVVTRAVTRTDYILDVSNEDRLWNAPPPPLRKPRPAERVWSMRRHGRQVDAQLRGHGEWGWECQFLYAGELAYGRRWVTRADALAEADEKRLELVRKGWTQVHERSTE
jgi:hypothetical protein